MPYPEEDPYDVYGSLDGMGYADMSENHVYDDPMADPFSQGRAATGASQSGYSTRSSLLNSQAIAKSSDSISALKDAIERQREPLTTEQAIAASLLALVPTVGGALIGKAVGQPDIPDGVLRSVNLKDWQDTGMAAGGLSGVKGGLVASDQYLKDLKPTEEENRLMEKLAQYENQQAGQLQTQANQAEMAGLNAAQREKEIGMRSDAAKELIDYRNAARGSGNDAVGISDPNLESALTKLTTPADQGGGPESLTPDERKALVQSQGAKAVSMTSQMINANSKDQNADRLLYGDLKYVSDLGVNRPDGFFKIKDKARAGQMTIQEASKLKEQGQTAANAVRSIQEAQEAFNQYGVAISLSNNDPRRDAAIGTAIHRIEFARKAIRDAYLTGSILAKGGTTDQKMAEIETLLVPPPLTEANANTEKVRTALTSSAPLRIAKLTEMQNNILNTLQSNADASGIEPRFDNIFKSSGFNAANLNSGGMSKEDRIAKRTQEILMRNSQVGQ